MKTIVFKVQKNESHVSFMQTLYLLDIVLLSCNLILHDSQMRSLSQKVTSLCPEMT